MGESITGTLSAGTVKLSKKKSTKAVLREIVNRFVIRSEAAADAHQAMRTDAMSVVANQLVGMGTIYSQWLGAFTQTQPAITANSIGILNSSNADSVLGFVKIGASLANSASPPTPAYQNLGTSGPGQGFMFPPKTTITTP